MSLASTVQDETTFMSLASIVQPTVLVVNTESFPTVAIVVLAVVAYMILFAVFLVVRKCIITNGQNFCPSWCTEICSCQTCCVNNSNADETGCLISCARACDFPLPNKQSCMDCLPTKQWCDDRFCSCLNSQSNECSGCKNTNCGECIGFDDCGECSKFCGDCDCSFCSQPDSVNCCCIEIKLAGNRQPIAGQQMNPYGGYMNYPGHSNQMEYTNQGDIINQQPPTMRGSYHPGHGGPFNPQQTVQFQNSSFNPNQSFGAGYQPFNSRLLSQPYPNQQFASGQQTAHGQMFGGTQSATMRSNAANIVTT